MSRGLRSLELDLDSSFIGRAALPDGGGLLLLRSLPFSFLIRCFRPLFSQPGDLDLDSCSDTPLETLIESRFESGSWLVDFIRLVRLALRSLLICPRFSQLGDLDSLLDDLDRLQLIDFDRLLGDRDRVLARLSFFRVVVLEENLDSNHFFFCVTVTTGIVPLWLEDSESGMSLNRDLKFLGREKEVELVVELPHLLLVHKVGWLFWGLRCVVGFRHVEEANLDGQVLSKSFTGAEGLSEGWGQTLLCVTTGTGRMGGVGWSVFINSSKSITA